MKLHAVFTAPVLVALATSSCSSSSQQDPGLAGSGTQAAASAPDVNPDGVPYPKDSIGTRARRADVPGNRIENFKFLGYPNADASKGLQPLSLAQYYDPSGNRYRVIHIQAAGVWCTACQAETQVIVPLKAQFESRKAVWLVSLAEGAKEYTPSVQSDLDAWIKEFKSPYTHWLDPNNANLGPFYDSAALPWNANIDARTMEILTAGTGATVDPTETLKEIDDAVKMTDDPVVKLPVPK
jgi:hypothetical protein